MQFALYIPPASQEVEMGLGDLYRIDSWDVAAHNQAHERDVAWVNSQVAGPRHAGSLISDGFSTDLSEQVCFQSKTVAIWAFGAYAL
jgi:hypothetical protein